jgi:hypothetical protein
LITCGKNGIFFELIQSLNQLTNEFNCDGVNKNGSIFLDDNEHFFKLISACEILAFKEF